MKKIDVENVINVLNNIKDFTKTMDFKTSTYINQQVISVVPVLEEEIQRLNNEKITINSPKLLLIRTEDLTSGQTLVDVLNTTLSELVENNFKIIDFGVQDSTSGMYAYVKYTD